MLPIFVRLNIAATLYMMLSMLLGEKLLNVVHLINLTFIN